MSAFTVALNQAPDRIKSAILADRDGIVQRLTFKCSRISVTVLAQGLMSGKTQQEAASNTKLQTFPQQTTS